MKKIALGGVVGLLVGLGVSLFQEPLLVKFKRLFQSPFSDHDNSPILIGDGSVHIKHGKAARSHFKSTTGLQIQEQYYQAQGIGYLCDPSPKGDCPVKPGTNVPLQCSSTPQVNDGNGAKCQVPLPTLPINTPPYHNLGSCIV